MAKVRIARSRQRPSTNKAEPELPPAASAFPIVGVGASAGGLEAFAALLGAMPDPTGMAFVFIQHLDPERKSMLPNILTRYSGMKVLEVTDKMAVAVDSICVIPPDSDVRIEDGVLRLVRRKSGRHMPVDEFLESLAEDQGARAIGVILSGTASDGTFGLKAIKAAGGITFAQDSESAKHDGMPRSAIATGCVDFVLPPEKIARELVRITRHAKVSVPVVAESPDTVIGEGAELREIVNLIKRANGVDFTHYKISTIKRRVARRMVVNKVDSVRKYAQLLHKDRRELEALHEDILIHVTGFFREPEAYRTLARKVFPDIVSPKSPGEPIRIWVAGCSTGEEVYSIAIVLLEYLGERANEFPVQIFGTDISERSIDTARLGIYSEASLAEVSERRRNRFFSKVDGGYQIVKLIREMCVLAKQDLTADPPFSKIDLISCRNVLIYMGAVLQKRVMAVFHYALQAGGYLLLGKSESLTSFSDLFALADRKGRLYSKAVTVRTPHLDFGPVVHEQVVAAPSGAERPRGLDLEKEVDRIVWRQYRHAGLVVSKDLEILHFRGDTSGYMAPAPGAASLDLLKMVRKELVVELRTAIHRAKKTGSAIRKDRIRVGPEDNGREVSVVVQPLFGRNAQDQHFLVLFEETTLHPEPQRKEPIPRKKPEGQEVARMEREIATTREYLQTIIEEQEATNEELKAANEEVLSSNEELQSTNEELETAKEELQSANEELVTLNEQQAKRNAELARISDDLNNVLTGINIPVVLVGRDLEVRRFTPAAERLLNLLPADIGRPITNIRPNYDLPEIETLIHDVTQRFQEVEREFQDFSGRWRLLRMRPYKTEDNKIDGAVMVFLDIHELRRAAEKAREAQSEATAIVETVNEPLILLDPELRVLRANPSFHELFQTKPANVVGRSLFELGNRRWDIPELKARLKEIVRTGEEVLGEIEVRQSFPKIGRKKLLLSARPVRYLKGDTKLILLGIRNITELSDTLEELTKSDEALRTNQRQLQELTASLLNGAEEERKRVSRELHDHLNQEMALLAVEADKLKERVAKRGDARLSRDLNLLSQKTAKVSDEIRRIAYRLHPAILEHLGLGAAMRALCKELTEETQVRIQYRQRKVPDSVSFEIALCIYRVAQQALRNVISHSGSDAAVVVLVGEKDFVQLSVTDRGRGFDPKVKVPGLGLISMQERTRLLSGKLTVLPVRGGGTQVRVRIPLGGKRA